MGAVKHAEVVDELNGAGEIEIRSAAFAQPLVAGDRDGRNAGLGLRELAAVGTALLQPLIPTSAALKEVFLRGLVAVRYPR